MALFFSPYSPYYRSSLVHPIVPSFTHILLLSRARCGRFISYLLNFIKHPGRQHGCIFHFLVSAGIVQKGSVVENGERGDRGVTMSGHSRCLSFFLRPFSRSSFPCHLPVHLYQRTCGSPLFLSLPASQRELGVTIQSSCFTFKSSCRAAISNHVRGMACVHVHYDHPRSTIFHGRAVRCRPALLP